MKKFLLLALLLLLAACESQYKCHVYQQLQLEDENNISYIEFLVHGNGTQIMIQHDPFPGLNSNYYSNSIIDMVEVRIWKGNLSRKFYFYSNGSMDAYPTFASWSSVLIKHKYDNTTWGCI